jgi:hypothetical protein
MRIGSRASSLGEVRFASCKEGEEEVRVPPAQVLGLGGVVEALERVLADRVQHPQAPAAPAAEEALDEERLERVEVCAADCLRGLRRKASSEDGQAAEQLLLVSLEKLVAPLDSRAQRTLALRGVAQARREERQPPLEPREKLVRIEERDACGRDSIASGSPSSRRQMSPTASAGWNPGATAPGSLDEEDLGVVLGQRLDRVPLLRCNVQRLAARDETFVFGVPARSDEIVGAASTTCSKLSRRTSSRLFATYSIRPSSAPTDARIARSTRAGSRSACSGAQKTPSGNASTASAAS